MEKKKEYSSTAKGKLFNVAKKKLARYTPIF